MGLSIYDMLTFLPNVGLVIGKLGYAAATAPFRGEEQAKAFGEHFQRKTFLALFSSFTIAQLQAILPPFQSAYEAWCKKEGKTPDVVSVPGTGIKGFWLGDKEKAKVVLVYFHGGGYCLPGLDVHVVLLMRMVEWSGGKMAIFCPCYSLAPMVTYPTPVGECVEAVRYVMDKYSQKELCLGGDSAGGNMTLAVLSHLNGHPHPDKSVVKELKLNKPLAGTLVIAPWVYMDDDKFESMKKFGDRDVINAAVSKYWGGAYQGNSKIDQYLWAETADPTWWKGAKDVTGKFLVCAGDDECLRDPIVSWVQKYKQGTGSDAVTLVVAKGEIHDHPLADLRSEAEVAKTTETTQSGAIYKWIRELVA